MELLLTGKWIGTKEAKRIGLVNHVVEKGKLLATCGGMAERIASFHPLVARRIKSS